MSRGPLRQRIVCLSQRSSTSWESCEERERAVAIEQREVSKSGVVPAGCYFCHLARPSSVRLSFLLSSSEWTHSEGIVIIINLKLALCVVCYEYFNILIKILYVNACVGVAFTLLCASATSLLKSWKSGAKGLSCYHVGKMHRPVHSALFFRALCPCFMFKPTRFIEGKTAKSLKFHITLSLPLCTQADTQVRSSH